MEHEIRKMNNMEMQKDEIRSELSHDENDILNREGEGSLSRKNSKCYQSIQGRAQ
jgi:Spy/CpxP family protein refolding chaperone